MDKLLRLTGGTLVFDRCGSDNPVALGKDLSGGQD
jgi:hypothetical protein